MEVDAWSSSPQTGHVEWRYQHPNSRRTPDLRSTALPALVHPTSIAESLTVLAEFAGVGLGGLDVDQLDIIALRLVAECGDEPSLTSFGPIVDDVRRAEGAADTST